MDKPISARAQQYKLLRMRLAGIPMRYYPPCEACRRPYIAVDSRGMSPQQRKQWSCWCGYWDGALCPWCWLRLHPHRSATHARWVRSFAYRDDT